MRAVHGILPERQGDQMERGRHPGKLWDSAREQLVAEFVRMREDVSGRRAQQGRWTDHALANAAKCCTDAPLGFFNYKRL